MEPKTSNSPLVGYNTNVRHGSLVFHIQTEDSGIGHPHIITHLFVKGTILATKKTSYNHLIGKEDLESGIRSLMKDQHRNMFAELRDGVHDEIAEEILGCPIGEAAAESEALVEIAQVQTSPPRASAPGVPNERVHVVRPAVAVDPSSLPEGSRRDQHQKYSGFSIFDAPDESAEFGDPLLSDKTLDEVILSYLAEETDD